MHPPVRRAHPTLRLGSLPTPGPSPPSSPTGTPSECPSRSTSLAALPLPTMWALGHVPAARAAAADAPPGDPGPHPAPGFERAGDYFSRLLLPRASTCDCDQKLYPPACPATCPKGQTCVQTLVALPCGRSCPSNHCQSQPGSKPSSSDTGALAGGIGGGVAAVVLLLLALGGYFWWRRKTRRRKAAAWAARARAKEAAAASPFRPKRASTGGVSAAAPVSSPSAEVPTSTSLPHDAHATATPSSGTVRRNMSTQRSPAVDAEAEFDPASRPSLGLDEGDVEYTELRVDGLTAYSQQDRNEEEDQLAMLQAFQKRFSTSAATHLSRISEAEDEEWRSMRTGLTGRTGRSGKTARTATAGKGKAGAAVARNSRLLPSAASMRSGRPPPPPLPAPAASLPSPPSPNGPGRSADYPNPDPSLTSGRDFVSARSASTSQPQSSLRSPFLDATEGSREPTSPFLEGDISDTGLLGQATAGGARSTHVLSAEAYPPRSPRHGTNTAETYPPLSPQYERHEAHEAGLWSPLGEHDDKAEDAASWPHSQLSPLPPPLPQLPPSPVPSPLSAHSGRSGRSGRSARVHSKRRFDLEGPHGDRA